MQNPIDLKKQELKSLITQKDIKQQGEIKEDRALDLKIANLTHEIEYLEKEDKGIKPTEKSTDLSDDSATSKNFSASKTLESSQQEMKKIIGELSSKGLLTIEKTTADLSLYNIKGSENITKIKDMLIKVYKKLAERGVDVETKEITNDKGQAYGFCAGFPAEYKGTKDVLRITDKEIDEIVKIKSEHLESGKKMALTYSSEVIGSSELVKGFIGRMMADKMPKEISSKYNSNQLQH